MRPLFVLVRPLDPVLLAARRMEGAYSMQRPGGEAVVHGFKGERVLMRIHVGEQDKYQGKPLYQQIIELLRRKRYAGATAFRGIMSFGATSKLHTDRFLELSLDLPVVVECVETEERIKAILPELDNMIGGGLITLERAKVIMYRPHKPEDEQADDWSVDVTGSWQATPAKDQAPPA